MMATVSEWTPNSILECNGLTMNSVTALMTSHNGKRMDTREVCCWTTLLSVSNQQPLDLTASSRILEHSLLLRNPELHAFPQSIKISSGGPAYAATSSVASYAAHASDFGPRYPLNAFCPHGHSVGWQIGENALGCFDTIKKDETCKRTDIRDTCCWKDDTCADFQASRRGERSASSTNTTTHSQSKLHTHTRARATINVQRRTCKVRGSSRHRSVHHALPCCAL
jgi:hypothetical protein